MTRPWKRPESVLVVVYSRDGQVLLLRRKKPADFWQSVTGSLEWDEIPEQAARRELQEETGLIAGSGLVNCHKQNQYPILPEWRSRFSPEVQSNTEHVFLYELPETCDIELSADEHLEYQWLTRVEAAEKVFSWTNRDAILALLNDG